MAPVLTLPIIIQGILESIATGGIIYCSYYGCGESQKKIEGNDRSKDDERELEKPQPPRSTSVSEIDAAEMRRQGLDPLDSKDVTRYLDTVVPKLRGEYSESYQNKLVDTYKYFKLEGIEFTEHALNQTVGRINQGRINSREQILDTLKTGQKYKEENGNIVYFKPGISVHVNNSGRVESVVPNKKPKSNWRSQ